MNPPFRVVRSYFRLPPEPGGMEEHIARLSAEQRRFGLNVVNLFNVGEAEGPNIQLYRGRDLLSVRPAPLRNLLFYAAAMFHTRELRSKQPTFLHVHGDWSDFLLGRVLAKLIGAQGLAASLHDLVDTSKRSRYRAVLRGYDLVFATGRADQVFLSGELGRPVHHMPSAPHPDFSRAAPPAAPYRYDVISVTNLFEKKNPGLVLDCAARRPDLHFALIGHGDLSGQIAERVQREQLTNVELRGRLGRAEIIAALQASRLFLSTAFREGTPTAALEAMAVGLPLVITPSNDYDWLIQPGRNGYVSSGWEVAELLVHIDGILADDRLAAKMAAMNRAAAATRSWQANAARVSNLMAERLGLTWRAA